MKKNIAVRSVPRRLKKPKKSAAKGNSTPTNGRQPAADGPRRLEAWFNSPRFEGITRLHSPYQVIEQRGTIRAEYPVPADAAASFFVRLRELFRLKQQITSFGPYSPGQAVMMKRMGIEGIYLGGWATSAKGGVSEDPGPDLASYPLNQVPDEAASIVRALLAADKNQAYARARMSPEERRQAPEIDYRPFIIADADTGHGGEAQVRNLVRRFVEAGVTGYHIEDQKPGVKKCGHQAGKVLVPMFEQNIRLNAARFQLDIMGVPGIVVARTDAEAATYLDGQGDERDHPFILGATTNDVPSYKVAYLAIMKHLFEAGVPAVNGHLLYSITASAYAHAGEWLARRGVLAFLKEKLAAAGSRKSAMADSILDSVTTKFLDIWQMEAKLKTYTQAVADVIRYHQDEGTDLEMSVAKWEEFASGVSYAEARDRAKSMGISVVWDRELPRTPEGYYQIQGGIEYAIARSVAAAPFADLLWMETKTAELEDARKYAEAVHKVYPDKMLAYNLSPSFNWDTTGMTEAQMRDFPEELGKLGYVFNFITYGGHQIDGLASEEFATALREDGMLALARLQRKFRLLGSPYRTPQTYVGGPRADAALMAASGRTATTKAMGKGSTQFQHLVQTEVPPRVLEGWLKLWTAHNRVSKTLRVKLRPHTAGSDLLSIRVTDEKEARVADVTFAAMHDRWNKAFLSIRDQNNHREEMRQKRLMTLILLFLIHRYKPSAIHFVAPTEGNLKQAGRMKALGIYTEVASEIGQIIVASINDEYLRKLFNPDLKEMKRLIGKQN